MASTGSVLGLATADGRRPRVAVVGGTPASALVAGVLIEQFGCSPISAPTGEATLALLQSDNPVDLVVIDLSVPDMDGMIAVQLIRALGARGALPIIGLADHRSPGPNPGSAGLTGTVVKPYSPRELYGAMRVALVGPATVVAGSA